MTILIADSGSTKTDWALMGDDKNIIESFQSAGLNPCLMDDVEIKRILSEEVAPHISVAVDEVRFYGAGCRPDQLGRMERLLCSTLNARHAAVASDLLGAAHALCGRQAGIVCILGTGSGSAVYDGSRFVEQTPSLGFILGDEGSGAVLGRRLVSDIFKRQLPEDIINKFHKDYDISIDEIIRNVYRNPAPNRYLAKFTRFLSENRENDSVRRLIINEFEKFFSRNTSNYNRQDLTVHFVGSIAAVFNEELEVAAAKNNSKIGNILRSPIEGLINYYQQEYNTHILR